MGFSGVAVPVVVYQLSNGEQLAFLEREGDYGWSTTSLQAVCGYSGGRRVDCALSPIHADHYCDGVFGVWRGRSAGVFVGQRATAFQWRDSVMQVEQIE